MERRKAKAIEGSEQYGEAGANNTLQIGIDLEIRDYGRRTTFLYFSPAAAEYAFARLRVLGWEGNDIQNLKGISKNEVEVEITTENYDGKQRTRFDIVTMSGVKMEKQVDKSVFASRLAALGLSPSGATSKQSADKPPFG